MLPSAFAKMVEDALREELLAMGFAYEALVDGVEEPAQREGCLIRMRGKLDDIEIVAQEDTPARDAIAAQVRRKLELALRGIDPFKTQAF